MFLTTYIYLEMIWSDFMKIDFFRFFDPQKIFSHIYVAEIQNFRPKSAKNCLEYIF